MICLLTNSSLDCLVFREFPFGLLCLIINTPNAQPVRQPPPARACLHCAVPTGLQTKSLHCNNKYSNFFLLPSFSVSIIFFSFPLSSLCLLCHHTPILHSCGKLSSSWHKLLSLGHEVEHKDALAGSAKWLRHFAQTCSFDFPPSLSGHLDYQVELHLSLEN